MIRSHHRPANAEDLKAMLRGKGSLARNILLVTLPVGAVLLAGTYFASKSMLLGAAIAAAFVLASLWSNVGFFRSARKRETSTVEVLEVEATLVVDIEPLGSHGPAYCFFSDDGNALLLVGQWLMHRPKFPCLSFRLLRWTDDGKPIRIEAAGPKVKAEHSTVGLRAHYTNGDVEVFRARAGTLQQDLEAAFGKRAA